MEVLNPLAGTVLFPHSGTFSANPLVMAAGLTAMELYDRDAVDTLNTLGERARGQIAGAIREADFPACVTGAGSLFRIHMTPEPPATYRQAHVDAARAKLICALLEHAFENGVMLINTCSGALSTAMTGQEIDRLAEVLLFGFRNLRRRKVE